MLTACVKRSQTSSTQSLSGHPILNIVLQRLSDGGCMPAETQPPQSDQADDPVVTPGGRRPRRQVHLVSPNQAVYRDKQGRTVVASSIMETPSPPSRINPMPRNLVLTPGGYRHPSLVHYVPANHAIHRKDGKQQLLNLATQVATDVEEFTPYPGDVPGFGTGWIAYAHWLNTTGQPITNLRTIWKVPPAPTTQSGQIIFLFNGIDPTNPSDGILQPVLQWGISAAGGGPYWAVASWYVGGDGHAFHTTPIRVNTGDTVVGVMKATGPGGQRIQLHQRI
jgi:hypothetical protein